LPSYRSFPDFWWEHVLGVLGMGNITIRKSRDCSPRELKVGIYQTECPNRYACCSHKCNSELQYQL